MEKVKLNPASTSLSDGDKWSASSPHNFTPGKGNHLHLLDRRVGGHQNLSACGGETLYPAEHQTPTNIYYYTKKCNLISIELYYEGESLNNRNFIIPFLKEFLQKLFVPYFST
jgi:hypothetical protein